MTILFWNLKGNSVKDWIKACLIENDVDIAIFAEHNGIDFSVLEAELGGTYRYISTNGGCFRICALTKYGITVNLAQEQPRYALYTVSHNHFDYVFAGVHLQDRRNYDSQTRSATIRKLLHDMNEISTAHGCYTNVIIGDFNANPYDEELLGFEAFHSVLFRDIIMEKEHRRYSDDTHRRLYNPILNFLSEHPKMYGSFYDIHGSSTPIWHCLDQMLVSRDLAPLVTNMCYLRAIAQNSLMNHSIPNDNISDHLPLLVRLKERS